MFANFKRKRIGLKNYGLVLVKLQNLLLIWLKFITNLIGVKKFNQISYKFCNFKPNPKPNHWSGLKFLKKEDRTKNYWFKLLFLVLSSFFKNFSPDQWFGFGFGFAILPSHPSFSLHPGHTACASRMFHDVLCCMGCMYPCWVLFVFCCVVFGFLCL